MSRALDVTDGRLPRMTPLAGGLNVGLFIARFVGQALYRATFSQSIIFVFVCVVCAAVGSIFVLRRVAIKVLPLLVLPLLAHGSTGSIP
jgi:hypothetical protein